MVDFTNKSVLSAKELKKSDVERVLEVAETFLPNARKEQASDVLKGKVMASLFFEPSTRTKLSFETAMQRLGGSVVSVVGIGSSSLSKGETLSDTAKVVETYADVIAVRHSKAGAPREMANSVQIPVLNAGDGAGEHPTQALLDLFTMKAECGKIDGLKIAIVGDLKYGRTVHSLVYLLALYDVELVLISPDQLKLPDDVTEYLNDHEVKFSTAEKMENVLDKVDVCYMQRIQQERFDDPAEYKKFHGYYVLTRELIEKHNPELIVMHPLPRVGEISMNVDDMPGAAYFRQMQNGVAVRMALLALVLGKA